MSYVPAHRAHRGQAGGGSHLACPPCAASGQCWGSGQAGAVCHSSPGPVPRPSSPFSDLRKYAPFSSCLSRNTLLQTCMCMHRDQFISKTFGQPSCWLAALPWPRICWKCSAYSCTPGRNPLAHMRICTKTHSYQHTQTHAFCAGSRVLDRFKLLGRAMAKALQDGRLLDIPLSPVFYRWVHTWVCLGCEEDRGRAGSCRHEQVPYVMTYVHVSHAYARVLAIPHTSMFPNTSSGSRGHARP